MEFSVIIPTYKRLQQLQDCLLGIDSQTQQPKELIIVWRNSDQETGLWLKQWLDEKKDYNRKIVDVDVTGVTFAMQKGLNLSECDVVAFIDDDAIPLPTWIEKMNFHYIDTQVGGVGGRDIVFGNDESPVASDRVGKLSWFGRLSGDHHRGKGKPVYVDVLKGVNMSFRRNLIEIPQILQGSGAQVHHEVYTCLRIRKMGYKLIYDPQVEVNHYPALRYDADQRGKFVPDAVRNASYNLSFSIMLWIPWYLATIRAIYGILVGDRNSPGLLRFVFGFLHHDDNVIRSFIPSMSGQLCAIRDIGVILINNVQQ